MKMHFVTAALTAFAVACLAPGAEAGCVISPDGKSIDVVTDNGASEETNCAVKCQVDTKIGVVQISCGGNTPPLAKAHSLCGYDKPEPWYKKVVTSEDTCKGASASATPVAAPPPAPSVKPGTFICRIAPDGHSFDAVIANPYKVEASCQVNCQISSTLGGSEQSSCSKNVEPGVGEVVLCTHSFDKGRLVKVIGGSGNCQDPTPKPSSADADDEELNEALQDPDKMQEYMRKRAARAPMPPPSAAKNAKKESAEDMEKLMDDPAKMDAYMRKQLDPASQKIFDEMNKQ